MNTLVPIDCRGSAFEAGLRYGQARRTELAQSVEDFFTLFGAFPLPVPLDRAALVRSAARLVEPAQSFDPESVAFARGQAQGAALDFAEVYCLHCFLELMFNGATLSAMCTSFAVTGPATLDGRAIAGQNVDWFPCTRTDLLRLRLDSGLDALAVCMYGAPYYFLTSAGLCNCANLTYGPQSPGPAVPVVASLFRAMRRKTLSQAMATLDAGVSGLGYFHLADREGAALGIESVPGRRIVLEPQEGVLAHANTYESPEFKPLDQGLAFMPDSPLRAARMRQRIASEHGRLTVERMMDILRDHSNGPYSICRHPDPNVPSALSAVTNASLVMLPAEGVLWMASGNPCENAYQEFRL